jgi:hypothetical protein
MKQVLELDLSGFLAHESSNRLNERITIPVSAEMYARLESLGKKKNEFIRTLLDQGLRMLEKAQEPTRVA